MSRYGEIEERRLRVQAKALDRTQHPALALGNMPDGQGSVNKADTAVALGEEVSGRQFSSEHTVYSDRAHVRRAARMVQKDDCNLYSE